MKSSGLIIKGGSKLEGEIQISGAKNSVLPILAASLICKREIILQNVPNISDVHVMLELLKEVGSDNIFDTKTNTVTIFKKDSIKSDIKNVALSEKIRASSLFLGPILATNHEVSIPKPGGCKIGARLIDMHLHFLEKMGATHSENENFITLRSRDGKLEGIKAQFYKISVGATQNIMIAGALAHGETEIIGASLEPEIIDLGNFLISLGVKIQGLGTSNIKVLGVENQNDLAQKQPYKIIYDRLETGTYAVLAAATKSSIFLRNGQVNQLKYFFEILSSVGVPFKQDQEGIFINGSDIKELKSKSIVTAPYPFFPTDLQQIYTSLMTVSKGIAMVEERIFNGRFGFADELKKMGAKIHQRDENTILVEGVDKLVCAEMVAGDLRGGMALLIAGIMADGTSVLKNIQYIERGYENFIEKLRGVGVNFADSVI
jgi:UDP-N-acetylglucosamine 1-carboxyvinyltransferase